MSVPARAEIAGWGWSCGLPALIAFSCRQAALHKDAHRFRAAWYLRLRSPPVINLRNFQLFEPSLAGLLLTLLGHRMILRSLTHICINKEEKTSAKAMCCNG
jgi:hypothetical protein